MPSVSVVQSAEPRQSQAAAQNRGREPFPDLLESISSPQDVGEEAGRAPGKRSDPAASVSRAQARSDSLARSDGPSRAQPGKSDDRQTATAASARTADGDMPEVGAAKPSAEAAGSTRAPDAADAEDSGSDAPVAAIQQPNMSTDAVAGGEGDITTAPEAESRAPESAPTNSAAPGDDAPRGFTGNSSAQMHGAAATSVAALPDVPADQDPPISAGIPMAQKAAASASPASTMMQTGNIANAAVPADDGGMPISAPPVPGPQPVPANAASPAAVDGVPAFADDAHQQLSSQQSGSQALSSKPGETSLPPRIETAASTAPIPDASAHRAPVNPVASTVSPEPVRTLAATFNPVSLHGASPPNSVPIHGTALAVEIASRVQEGMQRFEIRLDPPELGRVDVRLEVDRNGNVATKLTVDRPETLELMQREARGLERALQSAGLKTDASGLEFSLRSHADSPAFGNHSGSSEPRPDLLAVEESERAEIVVEGYRMAAHARGGVDIRV